MFGKVKTRIIWKNEKRPIGTLFVFVEGERKLHFLFSILHFQLSQSCIQHHHHQKPRHHTKCARMRMLTEMCLGNQLLDHDV